MLKHYNGLLFIIKDFGKKMLLNLMLMIIKLLSIYLIIYRKLKYLLSSKRSLNVAIACYDLG